MQNLEKYFDYAATTPLHPAVLAEMNPFFSAQFGNPSSAHQAGQAAFFAVEDARAKLCRHFHLPRAENLIFTGSSTEACNTVLFSAILSHWKAQGRAHVLISAFEHSAVRETVQALQQDGFCEVEVVPGNQTGSVDPREVARRIRPDTAIVSIIYGNNEIGTVNPIPEIAAVCREKGVPFHTDATQYAAHAALDVSMLKADAVTIAAHKCYGPKGIGAILLHPETKLSPLHPLIAGGKQENSRRAGTQNVPYIVGMGKAYELLRQELDQRCTHESRLSDLLIHEVPQRIPDCVLTGHPTQRLPNHISFAFKNVDSLLLQSVLDQKGFAVSIGSACRSNKIRGQQQLVELGLSSDWVNGGLRISTGLYSTEAAALALIDALTDAIAMIRKMSV